MNHIVYISPDCDLFEHLDALAHEAATKDQAEMLHSVARHEGVTVFKESKDFVEAFNDETVSDQGYLLLLDDGLSGKDYIVAMLKRLVHDLQANNALPGDPDTVEIPTQHTSVLPQFPLFTVVRGNGEGDWYEDKIQRLTLRRNNILTLTLEGGASVNAANCFIETLRTLHDALAAVNPRDNTIIQALSEQKEGTYYNQ